MARQCACGNDIPNIWLGTPANRTLLAPDSLNNIHVPLQTGGPDLVINDGDGIATAQTGTQGHTVAASVKLYDSPTNGLQFIDGGLFLAAAASSPDFVSLNTATQGGIRSTMSGQQNHTQGLEIVVAANSPVQASFNTDGEIVLNGATDVPWAAQQGDGIVITPGDNPLGVTGNGHRPQISLRDGVGLPAPLQFEVLANADQTRQVRIRNTATNGVVVISQAF